MVKYKYQIGGTKDVFFYKPCTAESNARQLEACRDKKRPYRFRKYAGKKAADFYAGFKLSDDGREIFACPGGIGLVSCSKPYKNGQLRVGFPFDCCGNCPLTGRAWETMRQIQ